MIFQIDPAVFTALPDYVVGVVVAKGIHSDLSKADKVHIFNPLPQDILRAGEAVFRERHCNCNYKEHPDLVPYREAFDAVGINPNRFPSSIEAMGKRVVGGASLPSIHPVIDLVNGISLTFALPMGAHDLDQLGGDFEVRFSKAGEPFIALGSNEEEILPAGELIYGDATRVRTRRWIWRQSEWGKVTEDSKNILFPIDGFSSANLEQVIEAREQLAGILAAQFGAEVEVYLLDHENRSIEF
jgi:DNA/RNA-binding domain of Phe-tRNA-synthetase-like protein